MAIANISAAEAKKMRDRGAIIVDIREPGEFAREHIDGAQNLPLSKIGKANAPAGEIVIYHCKSGMRTEMNSGRLPSDGCEAYILKGGIEAWKRAGMEVEAGEAQPPGFVRQLMVVAALFVVVGLVMSFFR